ncbi:MAG: ADP-L-glycero-D-manno-heptose 6-epimerase [Parcubacteria group bacterium Gr01-1014_56]|nr:MAG: ADP-L-glycero-D-manno-heptose 6-epimerase [Parcubacteria group bacterium Gr01-1014_56]
MNKDLIVITGALGFIGYNVASFFNEAGKSRLILVDREVRQGRLTSLQYEQYMDAEELLSAPAEFFLRVKAVVHLGASVNTGDTNKEAVFKNNFEYSKKLFDLCTKYNSNFIYASSAATYGDGSKGFDDARRDLEPRNYYAESKHAFDEFVRDREAGPPQVVGLKFFNVYGPFESHKGRMASTILFSYQQAKQDGVIKLFRSHNPSYKDGEQKRDFIYVGDTAKVINFFLEHPELSGIYNLGTGHARTFIDLAQAVFLALGKKPKIEFIETPEQFKKQYQYFTEADMSRFHKAGYMPPMKTLEEGIKEYVVEYLEKGVLLD